MTVRLAFVLEQTLGHVAHTANIERALAATSWVEPTVIKLSFAQTPAALRAVPGGANWSLRASLMARQALLRRLAVGTLDAVFIHTQVASLLSVAVMRRVPTVVSLDATPLDFDDVGTAYGHRRQRRAIEWSKTVINRRALRAASALVTWSRQAAQSLVDAYGVPPGKVTVIRPGVDLELFRPGPPRPSGDRLRVLFVGGDFVRKGGGDLLESARMLAARVELDVVTGRPVEVPAGVLCRVHRGLGPGDPRLLQLYRTADVFALPTRGDCLPQVLAEAAACALPIIATDTGAVSEVVRDGRNGLLVPAGSPPAIAAALNHLSEHPQLRRAMGRESLHIAREEHDAARNNLRIFELMTAVRTTAGERFAQAPSGGG